MRILYVLAIISFTNNRSNAVKKHVNFIACLSANFHRLIGRTVMYRRSHSHSRLSSFFSVLFLRETFGRLSGDNSVKK